MNKKYNTNEESIQQFVESLYEDGRTPSDRFGLSHEDLGKLEQELFDRGDDTFDQYLEQLMLDCDESLASGVVSVPDDIKTADEFYEWIMNYE